MQFLILQFVDPRQPQPLPEFSHGIGVLAALAKADGMTPSLLTLAGHQPQRLRETVIRCRPRCILVELRPGSVTAGRRTIGEIAEQFSLPVGVFGTFATCKPTRAISMPGVHALVLGEYERPAVELLKAWRDGHDAAGLDGVWVHTEQGVTRGELPAPEADLDALPFPDRELFDYERIVAATREVSFKAARGCPEWCGYCFNDWYLDLYADVAGAEGDGLVRRRGVGNLLDEVAQVVRRYDTAEAASFHDHCFAMDEAWLAEFAEHYPRRCALPLRCHVRIGRVNGRIASLLARAGCRWAHTCIPSGSRFIRDEIHSLSATRKRIVSGCRALKDVGIHVAAEVFVGNPYESEITLEETLALLHEAAPDEVHPRVYYPTPGTRAAELCRENGWVSGRGEENYWTGRSVLDMPSMPAEQIDAVAEQFDSLWRRPHRSRLRKILGRVSRSRKRGISKLLNW